MSESTMSLLDDEHFSSSSSITARQVPVTILTGFLGAGKTTALLSVLKEMRQRDSRYKICWLKNEFGDVAVDSILAKQDGAVAVKEILSGCICCNLVGSLAAALTELVDTYTPDRIFLETSGSAFPAPLAWEVTRLQKAEQTVKLDAIVCVIDCVNFTGYEDTSYTAKIQAKYTDLILLNKHEIATPQQVEHVIDQIMQLCPDTAIIRTDKGKIDADILLGLNTKLMISSFHPELLTHVNNHHMHEVQVLTLSLTRTTPLEIVSLEQVLKQLEPDTFFRVKGVVWLRNADKCFLRILNFAFSRWEWHPLESEFSLSTSLTFMGKGIHARKKWLAKKFDIDSQYVQIVQ